MTDTPPVSGDLPADPDSQPGARQDVEESNPPGEYGADTPASREELSGRDDAVEATDNGPV